MVTNEQIIQVTQVGIVLEQGLLILKVIKDFGMYPVHTMKPQIMGELFLNTHLQKIAILNLGSFIKSYEKNKILLIVLVVGIIVLGIVIFIKSQAVTETKDWVTVKIPTIMKRVHLPNHLFKIQIKIQNYRIQIKVRQLKIKMMNHLYLILI